MNKYFYFILFVIVSVISSDIKAEERVFNNGDDAHYRPFIEEGKQWVVILSSDYKQIYKVATFFFDGDTVIDSHSCKRLMCRNADYSEQKEYTYLYMYIYEEGKKVFYYPCDYSNLPCNPIKLYDFEAKPGDYVILGGYSEEPRKTERFQIWKSVELNTYWSDIGSYNEGEVFKGQMATVYDESLQDVDENSQLPLYDWYEGIGSVFHPFEKIAKNKYMGGLSKWLYECKVGDKVIYSYHRGYILANNIDYATYVNQEDYNYYSLDGKLLPHKPLKGIFVINGKKVMMK